MLPSVWQQYNLFSDVCLSLSASRTCSSLPISMQIATSGVHNDLPGNSTELWREWFARISFERWMRPALYRQGLNDAGTTITFGWGGSPSPCNAGSAFLPPVPPSSAPSVSKHQGPFLTTSSARFGGLSIMSAPSSGVCSRLLGPARHDYRLLGPARRLLLLKKQPLQGSDTLRISATCQLKPRAVRRAARHS